MIHFDLKNKDQILSKNEQRFYFLFIAILMALFLAEIFYNFEPVKLSVFFFVIIWGVMLFVHDKILCRRPA